ncbi:MarR family transcriptional regulator [Gordonia sp. TBRC 11910]|uniref:MarR family transcriptional regulator n=1 Tax=Gordonia asplenii TaxID=2725283 RepID=A0A848KLY4_9ACTN|nr:MarR family transcriptional regulator [Gordonia asplenii]NMN99675.1 MarR family transcriptional regulator [Gordonia asplenii]
MPEQPDLLATLAPLAGALRDAEDAAAAEAGLTMWQYAILITARSTRYNQLELATALRYNKNRIVGDLDRLVELGLVAREPDPRDRRANVIVVTDDGAALAVSTQRRVRAAEDALLADLTAAQRNQLRTLLIAAAASAQGAR